MNIELFKHKLDKYSELHGYSERLKESALFHARSIDLTKYENNFSIVKLLMGLALKSEGEKHARYVYRGGKEGCPIRLIH